MRISMNACIYWTARISRTFLRSFKKLAHTSKTPVGKIKKLFARYAGA
jgi:hypothetical protein